MKKGDAERLMIAAGAVDHSLSVVMLMIEDYLQDEERKAFRRAIAEVGSSFYTEFKIKILDQYPEFTPEHLKK